MGTSMVKKNKDVGYCKPPKEHQFSKGNPSKNPGNKSRSIHLKTLMEKLFDREVNHINFDNKTEKKKALQALFDTLMGEAIYKGNVKAAREILDRYFGKAKQHINLSSEDGSMSPLTRAQKDVLDFAMEYMVNKNKKEKKDD